MQKPAERFYNYVFLVSIVLLVLCFSLHENIFGGIPVVVQGVIVFDNDTKPFKNATVYIHLNDISFQDAPSELISERVIKNFTYDSSKHLPFELKEKVPDSRGKYSVTVEIDTNHDGKIGRNDFIDIDLHTVAVGGAKNNLLINMHQIN